MKLATNDREIERHSITDETKFSIKASGRAFRILSSSLYRNKIVAIVRELSCNAYDAHVAAGTPAKPFKVHLPNAIEPFFSVRDDGIGLSDEDMHTTYSTYFQSTKTGSNDFIGALGLGSKAPFSYVDSFTVVSRFEGVARTYAAFIDETGEPSLSRLSDMPTNEPNGLEVKLPVRTYKDFVQFRDAAIEVLSRFRHRPVVTGCAEFAFTDHAFVLEGRNWRVPDKVDSSHSRGIHPQQSTLAMMGNVGYPVRADAITGLSQIAQNVLTSGVIIDFPIGALDVTAGREDISYDKPTLEALERRAHVVYQEALALFATRFEQCANEREARILYGALFEHGFGNYIIRNKIKMPYRGMLIGSSDFAIDFSATDTVRAEVFGSNYRGCLSRESYGRNTTIVMTFPASIKIKFVIDDLRRGAKTRTIRARAADPETRFILIMSDDDADLAALMVRFEGFEIIKASELPAKPRKERAQRTSAMVLMSGWQSHPNRPFEASDWDNAEIEAPEDGGFYLRRRAHYVINETGTAVGNVREMLDLAIRCKLLDEDEPIYGFDAASMRGIVPQGEWKEVTTYIRNKVLVVASRPPLAAELSARAELNSFRNTHYAMLRSEPILQRVSQTLNLPDHPLTQFLTEFARAIKAEGGGGEPLRKLCHLIEVMPARPEPETLSGQWKRLLEAYPLIKTDSNYECKPKHMADYIAWCDATSRLAAASKAA